MAARRPVSLPKLAHPPAVTRRILRLLEAQHPGAFTELTFRNPYELLAATILSAQCTDERVNQVTPSLFARYPTPAALAKATWSMATASSITSGVRFPRELLCRSIRLPRRWSIH